jgi:hypothetical protein
MQWLLSGLGPLIAASLAVAVWHRRRENQNYPRRKPDYVWAFINGGITYVMLALLIVHYATSLTYSQELASGFGDNQVTVAFIAALFEAVWAYCDMWNGVGITPPAGG